MIVMQYRFTLPADYDMAVIEQRINHSGAKLDGFPGLLFKTFLFSRREEAHVTENRYAPLYVWQNAQAMTRFLQSAGFKKLTADFGWPEIETWLTLRLPEVERVKNAAWLSIAKTPILPHDDLASLALESQLCAWDVSRWQLLQVDMGDAPVAGRENYRIGYVATGEQ
jgi:heme-degrading monooxygenase HmoA